MIIYKITNIKNNKLYIGKTEKSLTQRWNKHIHMARNNINRYLYDAMNHYGYENFIIEEIDRVDSKEELDNLERHYISLFKSNTSEFGYNMTDGGDGGSMPLSSIEKAKITRLKNNNGMWQTKEASKKCTDGIRKFYKDNPERPEFSPKWKENIGLGIKNKWATDSEFRNRCVENCHMRGKTGDRHHFFGKHHTEESKKKIRSKRIGHSTSEKQKKIAKENWSGNKNPNFKEVDFNILIQMLKEKKSLNFLSNFFGNISVPGISYKIQKLFKVSSIKDIFRMVDEHVFEKYLENLNKS